MLMVGAGFLAAPMVANLIPWRPQSQAGGYIKTALAVTVGSQLLGKALGRKYGNALFAGGMISIAVDVLKNYVPALGGGFPMPAGNGGDGVGYYFPPDAELSALYGGNGSTMALAPGGAVGAGESVGRFSPRF